MVDPKEIPILSRYCKKGEEDSCTPTTVPVSSTPNSDKGKEWRKVNLPSASGMGSPCGSNLGWSRKLSRRLINSSDWYNYETLCTPMTGAYYNKDNHEKQWYKVIFSYMCQSKYSKIATKA